MIKIEGLHKSYKYHQVLKGLDMNVKSGEVYGFIGENGAGKTTTMNIICNIIPKDSGVITINGGNPYKIGYLPENPNLYNFMTANEYLSYIGACCKYKGNIKERNAELLKIVGLEQAANRKIKGYSRGMNQRMGLAATIYNDPDVIILDEPTSALDPQGRADVMNLLSYLKEQGKTIILSTHILTDVERVADTVGILVGGKLVREESLKTMLGETQNIAVVTPMMRNEQIHNAFMSIDFAPVEFTPVGDYEIRFEDIASGSEKLQKYLNEKGIVVANYHIKRETLESIYIKAVNSNAN